MFKEYTLHRGRCKVSGTTELRGTRKMRFNVHRSIIDAYRAKVK
jgi:hypothetical protein